MSTPTDISRSFYDKLASGDAPGGLGLRAAEIEWIAMGHYQVSGRGPHHTAEGLFRPMPASRMSGP